ncbi:uncharacterized protein M8220_000710 [Acridotheres tristis]
MMNGQGRLTPGTAAPAEERSCSWLNIWIFLIFALATKAAFVTLYLVVLFWHSTDQPRALQQQFSEWKCDSAVPQGTVRGWTCCPEGWRRFQRSCYFLSLDKMNWAESEQNCTGMGSHLVVINSKAEQVHAEGRERDPAGRDTVLGPGGDSEPLLILQGRGNVLSAPLQHQSPSATSPTPQGILMPPCAQSCTSWTLHSLSHFQEFLSEQIKQPPERINFHIGLFEEKEGQWQWVDGTPFDVTTA